MSNASARHRLELRPISTVLEAYVADLAARAGVPRPGIVRSLRSAGDAISLSPDSAVARLMDERGSKANPRSDDENVAAPPSLPAVDD